MQYLLTLQTLLANTGKVILRRRSIKSIGSNQNVYVLHGGNKPCAFDSQIVTEGQNILVYVPH